MRTHILSTGTYVPSRVVTNKELEKLMDTSDEWIQQRSGIKERRWVSENETTLSMAKSASLKAIDKAGLKVDDIDFIIFGCLVADYIFPGTGCLLQRELGFKKPVPALDIRNQCSGFVYALSIADAMIRSRQYRRILIVGSEIHSTSLNVSTEGRDISVLFGDAAGAMVVEGRENSDGYVIDNELHSEGLHAEKLALMKPSSNDHPRMSVATMESPHRFPVMDGKLVFKNAVERMTQVSQEILSRNKFSANDVDFVVPHQANLRINQMVMNQLNLSLDKTHNTLDRYGNTTMATIPITFDEAIELGKVKRGDLVLFTAFGAGFTWGANLLRY